MVSRCCSRDLRGRFNGATLSGEVRRRLVLNRRAAVVFDLAGCAVIGSCFLVWCSKTRRGNSTLSWGSKNVAGCHFVTSYGMRFLKLIGCAVFCGLRCFRQAALFLAGLRPDGGVSVFDAEGSRYVLEGADVRQVMAIFWRG